MSAPMVSSGRILALMERSLRIDARRWVTYVIRFAVIGMLLMTLISAQISSRFMGAPGRSVFSSTLYINFFIICAAAGYFASAVAEEKEEQTLGLLKMTGLSPLSILLGKSTSRLIGALLLLLIQFPFILLAITLGGVSLRQIVAGYATLLAFLFLVSNLSLFWSVICEHTRSASRASGFFLVIFLVAPGLCGLLLMLLYYFNWAIRGGLADAVVTWISGRFRDASPFTRLGSIVTTGFNEPAMGKQVWSNLALGLIFFGLAWWTFEAATRNDVPAAPPRSGLLRRTGRLHNLGARRAWNAPLAWKDFYFLAGGKVGMMVRVVLMAAILIFIAYMQTINNSPGTPINVPELGWVFMIIMMVVFVVEAAGLASRTFREEVKWKTLPALMVLPLTPRQIAYRKLAGGSLSLLPSMGFFLLGAFMAPSSFAKGFNGIFGSFGGWLGVVYVIFFFHVVAYLSLWIGWALAAGLLVCFFAPYCVCGMFLSLIMARNQFVSGMLIIPIVILLGGIAGLHAAIGARMRKLATE